MPAEPSIGFSISWIARMLRTRFDARARALGLTRAQWTMMLSIQLREGATQSELASRLEINTVTAGRILDRLDGSGWIERRPDPDDRRVNRLYLAAAAAPMLDQLGAVGAEEERVMLTGLGEHDLAELARLLGLITSNMKDGPVGCVPIPGDDQLASMAITDIT
jgi:MarR family transcriptional regulator, transcriptional regulator for hemolysin